MAVIGRKLLYARGVDENFATYATDYLLAVVCIAMATHLLLLRRRRGGKGEWEGWAGWSVLVIEATLGTGVGLIGGFIHQRVPLVEPYNSVDDLVVYTRLWRVACAHIALMTGAMLMLASELLRLHRLRIPVLIISLLLVLLTFSEVQYRSDAFGMTVSFITLNLAALVNFVASVVADYRHPRLHLHLHTAASFIFTMAGVINYRFIVLGCSSTHPPPSCPLSPAFNHNAVLHLMFIASATCYHLAHLRTPRHGADRKHS